MVELASRIDIVRRTTRGATSFQPRRRGLADELDKVTQPAPTHIRPMSATQLDGMEEYSARKDFLESCALPARLDGQQRHWAACLTLRSCS